MRLCKQKKAAKQILQYFKSVTLHKPHNARLASPAAVGRILVICGSLRPSSFSRSLALHAPLDSGAKRKMMNRGWRHMDLGESDLTAWSVPQHYYYHCCSYDSCNYYCHYCNYYYNDCYYDYYCDDFYDHYSFYDGYYCCPQILHSSGCQVSWPMSALVFLRRAAMASL